MMLVEKNPDPSRLEAGGIIRKGTWFGLPIVDWPIVRTGSGFLRAGSVNGPLIRWGNEGPGKNITISEYEPPEPPKFWLDDPKQCPDEQYVELDYGSLRIIIPAGVARRRLSRERTGVSSEQRNPKRVYLADTPGVGMEGQF